MSTEMLKDSHPGGRNSWRVALSLRWMGPLAARPLARYGAAVAALAVSVLLAMVFSAAAPSIDVSILFMLAVLASAILWGLGPALLSAALGVTAWIVLFVPPTFSLRAIGFQSLLDLAVFSSIAVLASSFASHVRRQTTESEAREATVQALYGFSRHLAGIADSNELYLAILDHLEDVLKRRVMLLLPVDGGLAVLAARMSDKVLPDEALAAAERLWRDGAQPGANADGALPWRFQILRTGRGPVGVLAVEATGGEPLPVEPGFLESLLDQSAVAIERTRFAAAIEDARVAAKTEKLREAVIHSISHDLQTPLASIIGSATALQSFESLYDRRARGELLATIREEAERLDRFIANILDMTRIRAGEINPRFELVELADIINAALRSAHKALADHEVVVDMPVDLPMLRLDLFLMEHAFVNLLENAAKYSPKGTKIRVQARQRGREIHIEIADAGVGIASEELDRIFERFYRAATHDAKPAGTGLGLTICRAFVDANGGRIEASSPGPGRGASFHMVLPAPEPNLSLESAIRDE